MTEVKDELRVYWEKERARWNLMHELRKLNGVHDTQEPEGFYEPEAH